MYGVLGSSNLFSDFSKRERISQNYFLMWWINFQKKISFDPETTFLYITAQCSAPLEEIEADHFSAVSG